VVNVTSVTDAGEPDTMFLPAAITMSAPVVVDTSPSRRKAVLDAPVTTSLIYHRPQLAVPSASPSPCLKLAFHPQR